MSVHPSSTMRTGARMEWPVSSTPSCPSRQEERNKIKLMPLLLARERDLVTCESFYLVYLFRKKSFGGISRKRAIRIPSGVVVCCRKKTDRNVRQRGLVLACLAVHIRRSPPGESEMESFRNAWGGVQRGGNEGFRAVHARHTHWGRRRSLCLYRPPIFTHSVTDAVVSA